MRYQLLSLRHLVHFLRLIFLIISVSHFQTNVRNVVCALRWDVLQLLKMLTEQSLLMIHSATAAVFA